MMIARVRAVMMSRRGIAIPFLTLLRRRAQVEARPNNPYQEKDPDDGADDNASNGTAIQAGTATTSSSAAAAVLTDDGNRRRHNSDGCLLAPNKGWEVDGWSSNRPGEGLGPLKARQ